MKAWWILTLLLSFMLVACGEGETEAETPNFEDCYAFGTCQYGFGFNTYGYGVGQNFSPYNVPFGQSPYNNGFYGCGFNQYPVYYPNYGYACVNHSAFNYGYNYGTWNYNPLSFQLSLGAYLNFPSLYNYSNNFAFQGCVFGASSCACQSLYGVPSQYGVCGYY